MTRRRKKPTAHGAQNPAARTQVPSAPALGPAPEKSPTEFERLKNSLLNNRYAALVLLAKTVCGLGIKQVSDSLDFFKRFRAPVISVKAASRRYESIPSASLVIPLTITLVSADKDQINDVKIHVSAEEVEDDGTTKPVSDEDLPADFIIDPESIDVGSIDTKTGATPHDLKMIVDASGEYRLRISAMSVGKEVGYTQVALSAISKEIQDAVKAADPKSPVVVVKHDGPIEPSPVDYRKLSDFTLLLVREYNEKGDTDRSSLRLRDYYVGSCPKGCRIGYGDLGGATVAEPIGDPPGRNMTEVGLMEYGPVNRFPIGTRIYQLDWTQEGLIAIRDVTAIACVGERGVAHEQASYEGKERTWEFKSLKLRATESEDCGATGRICVSEVSVSGQTFRDVDSNDDSEPNHAEIPAFFDPNRDDVKRLYFDEDGNMVIQKCALDK